MFVEEAGIGGERIEGKLREDKGAGDWLVGRWMMLDVDCIVMVLGLTLFCVEHVGSGVIRGVWAVGA